MDNAHHGFLASTKRGPVHFTAAVLLAFWGIAGYAFPPLQQARLIALAPAGASAVLALNASALYIGVFAGAVAGGTIVHSVGLTRVGIAGAGLALATLIAFLASCRSGQTIRSVGKQPL